MAQQKSEIRLNGIAASPGIAIGKVTILGSEIADIPQKSLASADIDAEIQKFDTALQNTKRDTQEMYQKSRDVFGEDAAEIFNVHIYLLEDPMLVDETKAKIRKEKINADFAFSDVMDKYIGILKGMKDELFNARTADIRDLKRRVIRYIRGEAKEENPSLDEPTIVFANELTPSDTIRLERSQVLGFAMDYGARTSHATILARSIGVPAVVGLNRARKVLQQGDQVILDGEKGLCIVYPTKKTLSQYEKRYEAYLSIEKRLANVKDLPARTKDGKDVELASNIEFPEEIEHIRELAGDGIGLYRTEYLFLAQTIAPSEDQQVKDYKSIADQLDGKPLIIRTFDLGGDKPPVSLSLPPEDNPFLGVRGIRLYRDSGHDLFRTQIRAILRASVFGDIRIMFPMVACVSELRYCKAVIKEIQEELDKEQIPYNKNLSLGVMIEVPSAAATADIIAKECDFLSIGTNDLIQYTTAVDRGNKNLTYLYQPYNPAVLRFIQQVILKGHDQGAWVGMCGEMASDPIMTMVLIGLGLDEFSVSPVSHLLIKTIIRHVDFHECESMARKALDLSTSEDIENYLKNVYKKKFGKLLSL